MTFGTVELHSTPNGALGGQVLTSHDSIWTYGNSAVACIVFPTRPTHKRKGLL